MRRNQITSQSNPNKLLDNLLALDRKIVERFMHVYKIPRRERLRMRAQNRRLHSAVREIDLSPRNLAVRNRRALVEDHPQN